jgi:hypothetical protein
MKDLRINKLRAQQNKGMLKTCSGFRQRPAGIVVLSSIDKTICIKLRNNTDPRKRRNHHLQA